VGKLPVVGVVALLFPELPLTELFVSVVETNQALSILNKPRNRYGDSFRFIIFTEAARQEASLRLFDSKKLLPARWAQAVRNSY
jgi:hypothetical protein